MVVDDSASETMGCSAGSSFCTTGGSMSVGSDRRIASILERKNQDRH
jgi:hypothetical protein